MSKKLFVSFTALIRDIGRGTVTDADLAAGLFYFGCAREHALTPWKDHTNELKWFFKNDGDRAGEVHSYLRSVAGQRFCDERFSSE